MTPYRTFTSGNRHLRLNESVLEKFRQYEQIRSRKEAGGVLLGKVFPDYDEILDVTVPNRSDKRGLFFFHRALKPAQLHIDKGWKESGGKLMYLGEWHSHPEKDPTPSHTDLEMIHNMHSTTRMEIDYLYLIIVGLENTFYVARQENDGVIQLRPE